MSGFDYGFWSTADKFLQRIGRGVVWLVARNSRRADDVAYAVLGGSLLCAMFGGILGFALSNLSRGMAGFNGALIGVMIGACVGVFFGSFVEAVDEYIRNVLRSIRLR
jgi:urea transporter